MAESNVAKRYAKALFDLAIETNRLDAVCEDMRALRTILAQTPALARFLDDPLMKPERREVILRAIFESDLEALVFRFMLFLEAKHRMAILADTCSAVDALYDEHKGILKVSVISARELAADQVTAIEERLHQLTDKTIETRVTIDPALLGGFKVILGDRVLDFTLQRQLSNIKRKIISG